MAQAPLKAAFNLAICGVLFTLVHCIPVEIVYNDQGCNCQPTRLGYQIFMPKPTYAPKSRSRIDYGYKVEVPVEAKAKVSYTFDFTVDKPKPTKPPKYAESNLYAKIDRIALNRKDCKTSYRPLPAPAPAPPCSCEQCSSGGKPIYGYVYESVKPCQCNRSSCQCNAQRTIITANNDNVAASTSSSNDAAAVREASGNAVRRKRDLQRVGLFRTRKGKRSERPGRFVKLYHKELPQKRTVSLFSFERPANVIAKKDKRKTKKALFPKWHSRLVKRDIKGEYDLLEQEREQMDLTLPEIVQYMPETLQPHFERGPCQQCKQQQTEQQEQQQQERQQQEDMSARVMQMPSSSSDSESERNDDEYKNLEAVHNDLHTYDEKVKPVRNDISYSYRKRNVDYSNYDTNPQAQSAAATTCQFDSTQQTVPPQNAYRGYEQTPALIPINTYYIPSPYRAPPSSAPTAVAPSQYGNERADNNDRTPLVATAAAGPVSDPTGRNDQQQLQYASELQAYVPASSSVSSPFSYRTSSQDRQVNGAYPVEHISNDQLDKIIRDIIFRHPDFVEATSHYGGGLVDPTPYQREQTEGLIRKLIDGRLNLYFGDKEAPIQSTAPYNVDVASYLAPYRAPDPQSYASSFY